MLARFLTNTRGGVAPLMAVMAVPIMAAVGMAVDYSRINAARTAFQVALDLFSRPEVTDITVSPVYTSAGGSKLTLNGTAIVHTNFLGVRRNRADDVKKCGDRNGRPASDGGH
jgi:hypothetical protein